MNKTLAFFLILLLSSSLFSQDKYVYTADIKNIVDDKISVELVTPAIKEQEAVFTFPRVIPGSYSEKNYGKYIDDFKAFDKEGKSLKVKKLNKNQYTIANAFKMGKITYKVNDTWDTPDKDFIFQPGGSNIESGKNVIMNNHAFYGYLDGYNTLPFEIKVTKVKSSQVSGYLQPMALALQQFFNGLPVDSYQFLYYFEDPEVALADKESGGGGYGALEHNYSSLYFLPEIALESRLKSMVNEVSSHEFLHILTPLNLHSELIENFDYVNPKMSKHLWLYEGVTEYFANLVQVQSGLITEKQFFRNMRDKINEAAEFGDFSMTTMSEKVLEGKYKEKYSSVYNRGALIGLMLDIFIREKTNHEKDLKKVIMNLTKKYGAGRPFADDGFLAEFVEASHPEVQAFIDNYINGEQPLPFAEYFGTLGYEFSVSKRTDVYFAGKMGLKYDEPNKAFAFSDVEKENALDIKEGDLFIAVENTIVTDANLDELWEKYFQQNNTYTSLTIKIKRNGEEKMLSGNLFKGYLESKNYVGPITSPSAAQRDNLTRLITH